MTQELIETVDVLRPGKSLVVAIDGPSGSGKSSVSKEVARRLKLAYLDTGAMYRALTWFCLENGTDLDDGAAVEAAAEALPLEISTSPQEEYVRVGGHDVTLAIREPAISAAVSAVATTLGARTELIRRQRELIEKHHRRMVVEGRDITTVVAPHAEVRMLLTASEEARLRRRGIQLGGSQNAEQLAAQVTHRDAKDSTVVNFTTAADGVVTLDSSELDFDETVQAALDIVDTVVNHISLFRTGPSTVTEGRAGCRRTVHASLPGHWTTAWSRPVGWLLDHLVYRTSVSGRSNVPAAGPVIFAGNHISFLDGPVMFGASPRPMHILVKQEMFTGFLGRVLAASGQLPVDRRGGRAALATARSLLDAGRCVGILPEGTRGSGEAAAINNGVAWLALNSGATVVPVAILGTQDRRRTPGHGSRTPPAAARQLRRGHQRQPQAR